jgi:hypothetical protein
MTYDPSQSRNPFGAPLQYSTPQPSPGPQKNHSGLGIASLVIGVFSILVAVGAIGLATFITATNPIAVQNEDPVLAVIGLGIIGAIGLSLMGMGLGIGSLFVGTRSKILGILGIVANFLVLFGLCGIMIVGIVFSDVV